MRAAVGVRMHGDPDRSGDGDPGCDRSGDDLDRDDSAELAFSTPRR
ncbi:hypothetical protein [Herbiconiux ginsengi]|nr:hypothetical protein [Herbiconiux ginsengi]